MMVRHGLGNRMESKGDIAYEVVGCAIEVMNEIGHGLREKTYERALLVELDRRGKQYSDQKSYPIIYKGEQVDVYIPDILVEQSLIVEIKTVESICDEHFGQVINYLRVSGCQLGLIRARSRR